MRLALALVLLLPAAAHAQREGVVQIGSPLSDFVERQATAGRLPLGAADALPLSARVAAQLLDSLAARPGALAALAPADRALAARYLDRTPATLFGRPAPLGLYADGVSFSHPEGDGYAFEIAPLLDVSAGPAARSGDGGLALRTTRGVRAAGRIGRLYVETRATENQVRPLVYARDSARATAPRLGFVKADGPDGYDFFRAEGAVGYHDRFLDVRFARDRNRWGAGVGTLFLSDYAAPYDHLRVAAAAGPVRYTMVVARLTTPDRDGRGRDAVLPSKYAAFHRFALEVGRVQLEAFETVVFHDDTLRGHRRGLELGYLNPVIFYRAVESELGSGDNALLGGGLSVRPVDGARLYGQVLLDEFRAATLFEDAWTNKWGLLAGAHLVDVGLPGLEVRAEAARLRPYLYGHRTVSSAYVHYDDLLGHPVGPNAQDLSLWLRYRPSLRASASLLAARTVRGRDPDGSYVGADPRVSYDRRAGELAPTLGGVRQTEWLVEGAVGYELLPRLVVEAAGRLEQVDDAERGLQRAAAATLGLRWELPFQSARY